MCSGRSTSSGGRLVPNCGPPELLKRSEARAIETTSSKRDTAQKPDMRSLHATGQCSRNSAQDAGGSAIAAGSCGSHSGVRRSTSRPVRLIESQVI